jgi:hypothetical protein
MHYLPLPLPFFSILVGMFAVLIVLLQLGALRYAYRSIGLSPSSAVLVLLVSVRKECESFESVAGWA